MKEDSLLKKYSYRLLSNLINLLKNLMSVSIVPQALGPDNYGAYSFLTNFFLSSIKFLKVGIPDAFLTKFSSRQNEKNLVGVYFYFTLTIVLLLSVLTFTLVKIGYADIVWPQQKTIFIYLALIFGVLSFLSESNFITNDALGNTIIYEKKNVIRSIIFVFCLIIISYLNVLTLANYFILQYLSFTFIIIFGLIIIRKDFLDWREVFLIKKNRFIYYCKEFFNFSHPLFSNKLIVYISSIFDLWLLQFFYGSEEQAFFHLGLKIGGVFFIFTSSVTTLIVRDFSINFTNEDNIRIKNVFNQIPVFYFVSSYFGIFVSLHADHIIQILGQEDYINAIMPISILALYSLHRTYGQLIGGLFISMSKTKVLRNVVSTMGLFGIILSFIILAPEHYFGFQAGASGLGFKMVIIQFFQVNILLMIATKILKISFKKYLVNQFSIILIHTMSALFSLEITNFFCSNFSFKFFLISGFVYSIIILSVVILYPQIIFKTKKDLSLLYNSIFVLRKKYL
tara:strand:- start:1217 stop:2746 length:1530 start_codon:yes stop_codon:yes gene_type:complete